MRKAQSTHWDSRAHERLHRDKLARKAAKVQGLRDLIEVWEAQPKPDYDYLRDLKMRLRSTEAQFNAMAL